jgi:hypothetical protein
MTVTLAVRIGGGPAVPAGDPHAPSPYTITVTPSPGDPTDPLAGICPAPSAPPPHWGYTWIVTTTATATGAVVGITTICVPLLGGVAPPGPPPSLPTPPTIGDIWAHAALPAPSLGLSPVTQGVTGLATWIWGVSPTTAQIDATIDGFTVTGVARIVGFVFDTGDGTVVARDDGGSASNPALRHEYERTGSYPLSVTTIWSATVTVSGPGFAPLPTPIGEALLQGTYDYPVVQVRSVLIQ